MNLHLMVGITGSNREEIAKEIAGKNGAKMVSSHDVRTKLREEGKEGTNSEVFEVAYREVKTLLTKGVNVVFDATNLTKKHRLALKNMVKGHKVILYYISRSLEDCIETDKNSVEPQGEEVVLRNYLTAEIPQLAEGFEKIYYIVEKLDDEEFSQLKTIQEMTIIGDPAVFWANYFLHSGKLILDQIEDEKFKKVGYNNISAQIAFRALHSLAVDINTIEEVMQLILFKKRMMGSCDKGKEKLKKQLGENLFQKLEILNERETA